MKTSDSIERNGSLGSLTYEEVTDYLTGKMLVQQFRRRCSRAAKDRPFQFRDEAVLGFLAVPDKRFSALTTGTRQTFSEGPSLFFAQMPQVGQFISCIEWSHANIAPRVIRGDALDVQSAFSLQEPWLLMLWRLQAQIIQPLLACVQFASPLAASGIRDEIEKRIIVFGRCCHSYFLQDARKIIQWQIASRWKAWELADMSFRHRCDDLCAIMGITMKEHQFKSIASAELIPGVFETSVDDVLEQVNNRNKLLDKEVDDFRAAQGGDDASIEPLNFPFSKGGYFHEHFYYKRQQPIRGLAATFKAKPETLPAGLWWWREMSGWCCPVREEFPDNWERSAFLYELRGRLLPGYTWDIFDRPWLQLDVTQRAVLYYIWPPEKQGPRWRSVNAALSCLSADEIVNSQLVDDMANPSAKSLAQLQYRKRELQGVRDKSVRVRPGKAKSWMWSLLEELDEEYYQNLTLSDGGRKAKLRAEKEYKKACLEAEIPHDRRIGFTVGGKSST